MSNQTEDSAQLNGISKEPHEEDFIRIFQWFHTHPELSFEEIETTKRIRELLTEADIEILDLPLETGLVAQVRGSRPGPVIAIRCDIDALPIQEETDLPYRSQTSCKMHACGHDFHIVSILWTALLLKKKQEQLKGTVKIIFQPGEESSLGALKIVESGVLSDVELIYGIHSAVNVPVGAVGIKAGSVTAAVDKFEIAIEGKGCHAAHPHEGIDPIVIASQLVSAAQSIVSRNIDPFDQGLVSITHVSSGSTWNVIPTAAFLEGTVRTLRTEVRKLIPERLEELAVNIAKAFRATAEFKWIEGPPATDNDKEWADFSARVAEENQLKIVTPIPSLGGEDFAFYQQQIKGVFIQIGTGESYPGHHPKFQVDPGALKYSAAYIALLAEKSLEKLQEAGRGRVEIRNDSYSKCQ